ELANAALPGGVFLSAVGTLRQSLARSGAQLVRRMPLENMGAPRSRRTLKLSSEHLRRYKQIARLLWRYGRSDLVAQMGIDEALEAEERTPLPENLRGLPEQLADDPEAMGPTYVKLGQVLSSRPGLLPDA